FRKLITFAVTVRLDRRIIKFFQIGQRWVDHAGAGCVEPVGTSLKRFDKFIPMAGLLFEQSQQHQLQLLGPEFAAAYQAPALCPHTVWAFHSVPSACAATMSVGLRRRRAIRRYVF